MFLQPNKFHKDEKIDKVKLFVGKFLPVFGDYDVDYLFHAAKV